MANTNDNNFENIEKNVAGKYGSKNKSIFFISILIPILIAIVSFTLISKTIKTSNVNNYIINQLQERQETIFKISAITTGSAVATSFIPGNTQISSKIFDLTKYFIIILFVIVLEKYLFAVMGVVSFQILIPISCVIFVVDTLFKKLSLRFFAIKVLIFALLSFSVVPACVGMQSVIEKTNTEFNVQRTLNIIENLKEQTEEDIKISSDEVAKKYEINITTNIDNTESDSNNIDKKENSKSIFGSVGEKVKNIVGKFGEKMSITLGSVVEWGTDKISELTNKLNIFIEQIVVLLVVNCAFPVLVVVFYLWLLKKLFGVEIEKSFYEKFNNALFNKRNSKANI